jgi:hypothetical protein
MVFTASLRSTTFEDGYLYQLNDDGNLVRFRILPELKWGAERKLPIVNETVAPSFTSTPRKLWLLEVPDDVHVDVVAVADERDTWSVPDAPALQKGDGIFLWAGAPHHCVVAFAEVNSDMVRDEAGDGSFEIRILSHTFVRPLYRDDLAYEQRPIVARFSFTRRRRSSQERRSTKHADRSPTAAGSTSLRCRRSFRRVRSSGR